MEERRSYWKQVVLTAIITGVITFGAGMLINAFQTREPHLTYSVEDTLPFEGPLEYIAIYNIEMENDGRKIVEDVVLQLSFSTGTIQQSRVILEPSIIKNEEILNNSYRLELPNLNPGEGVTLSVLVSNPEQLPSRPEISVRGKGVTGMEASKDAEGGFNWVFVALSVIIVYAFLSFLAVQSSGFRKIFRLESSKHSEDQRQILAYVCGIHNLDAEVERYLNMPSEVSYWAESDRFSMLAVKNPAGEDSERRKQVLKDLLEYTQVHRSSAGIVHYNIARIAKAQGKDEEANDHIEKAKRLIPRLLKSRVELDPIWGKNNLPNGG